MNLKAGRHGIVAQHRQARNVAPQQPDKPQIRIEQIGGVNQQLRKDYLIYEFQIILGGAGGTRSACSRSRAGTRKAPGTGGADHQKDRLDRSNAGSPGGFHQGFASGHLRFGQCNVLCMHHHRTKKKQSCDR